MPVHVGIWQMQLNSNKKFNGLLQCDVMEAFED